MGHSLVQKLRDLNHVDKVCDFCGSTDLMEVTTEALGRIVMDKDLVCYDCKRILNHWNVVNDWEKPFTKTGRLWYSTKAWLLKLLD